MRTPHKRNWRRNLKRHFKSPSSLDGAGVLATGRIGRIERVRIVDPDAIMLALGDKRQRRKARRRMARKTETKGSGNDVLSVGSQCAPVQATSVPALNAPDEGVTPRNGGNAVARSGHSRGITVHQGARSERLSRCPANARMCVKTEEKA